MESKQKRTRVVLSVLALAGLAVFSLFAVGGSLQPAAPPGPTMKTLDEVEPRIPIHASDLPLTITEPNSYYLAEDISFASTANHAITIQCNDVTIDLMGFTLKGPDSGTKAGIYMFDRSNVEIRNGTVRDFYNGIYEPSTAGKQHRVINVRAMSNTYSGVHLYAKGNLVKDCTAADNTAYGIYADTGSTVTRNTAYNNQYKGIFVNDGSTVTDNTAYNNQSIGISTGPGCTVRGNTAYNNQSHGIASSSACTVSGNTAYYNNASGITVSSGTVVSGNTAYYNNYYGIFAGGGCTVIDNATSFNNQFNSASYAGIYAGSDSIVKRNTAWANKQNNIYVFGSDCAIEENLVTDSNPGNGIKFNSIGNFYANNRASGNGTDYAGNVPVGAGDGGGNASF